MNFIGDYFAIGLVGVLAIFFFDSKISIRYMSTPSVLFVFCLLTTALTAATDLATGQLLEGNVGLITITNFDDRCAQESIAAIESLMEQGADRLIFDVRGNPGGFAHELVALLDYLLPEGDLFRTVDYQGREDVDTSDAKCLQIPMVVLVNRDSYSAAEFFAVALQEYGAARVVGEKTSGKGYYQVVYQLSDGSAVGLSIGKYVTPKGVSLEGVGITPDVIVEVTQEQAAAIYAGTLDPMEDPQILAAIAALKG
jgi:carboxyl-terminal processing protease